MSQSSGAQQSAWPAVKTRCCGSASAQTLTSLAVVIAVAFAVCIPSFENLDRRMVDTARLDDMMAIARSPLVTSPVLDWRAILRADFWGTDMHSTQSHRSWRPLATALFWLQHRVGSGGTLAFRATNVSLRLVLVAVAFFWFRQLAQFASSRASNRIDLEADTLAACMVCLMAVHPMHVDTYAMGVGQGDTLCAILVTLAASWRMRSLYVDLQLGSFCSWSWMQDVAVPCAGYLTLCVLAGTAKEIGAMLVPVVCFMDALVVFLPALLSPGRSLAAIARGKHFARCAVLTVAWVALMYLRLRVVQPGPPAMPQSSNFIAAHPSFFIRALTLWWAVAWHFTSVLAPTSITADRGDTCIGAVASLADPRNITTVCFLLAVSAAVAAAVGVWRSELLKPLQQSVKGSDKKASFGPKSVDVVEHGEPAGITALATVSCATLAVVTFLPASNLLFTTGFVIAERIMLLPSIGILGALVVVLSMLSQRPQNTASSSDFPKAIREYSIPCTVAAVAILALGSMSYHHALNEQSRHLVRWLQVCPRSRRAWLSSANIAQDSGFLWPTQAKLEQIGCHSDMGWLHDCKLQRHRQLETALDSLAQPPTNCTPSPYIGCHPFVYDLSRPAPSEALVRLQGLCERSASAQPVPAPHHSYIRADPGKEHVAIRSIPYSVMSAAERLVCAAALGPEQQMAHLQLSMIRLSAQTTGERKQQDKLLEFIQKSYMVRRELNALTESTRIDDDVMLLATWQRAHHTLTEKALADKQASEVEALLQHFLTRYHTVSIKTPSMMFSLYEQASKSFDPWLHSTRSSAATSSVVIAGVTDPPDFIKGIASMLLSVQFEKAKQFALALRVLTDMFQVAGCAAQDSTTERSLICSYCPLYGRLARVHHLVSQIVDASQSAAAVREAAIVADLGMSSCALGRKDQLETVHRELAALVKE